MITEKRFDVVALGELLVCYLLGMVLLEVLSRSGAIPRREITR